MVRIMMVFRVINVWAIIGLFVGLVAIGLMYGQSD